MYSLCHVPLFYSEQKKTLALVGRLPDYRFDIFQSLLDDGVD